MHEGQVLVPIKDTLTWETGGMTLAERLHDFLWDVLEEERGLDAIEPLLEQEITIEIDGAYFVVGVKT